MKIVVFEYLLSSEIQKAHINLILILMTHKCFLVHDLPTECTECTGCKHKSQTVANEINTWYACTLGRVIV